MAKGWIELDIELLHAEDSRLFDFVENNFKTLEVDHSNVELNNTATMLLEDDTSKWFISTVSGEPLRYVIVPTMIDDTVEFNVELVR